MNTFLFLLEIDPLIAGATYKKLPLHCTLIPWFDTEMPPGELLGRLAKVFRNTPSFELISGESVLFGKDSNIPVHVLQKNPNLSTLHETLVRELISLGIQIDSTWTGPSYQPHVTSLGGKSFPTGSKKCVAQVSVMKALNEHSTRKKILYKRILLGT